MPPSGGPLVPLRCELPVGQLNDNSLAVFNAVWGPAVSPGAGNRELALAVLCTKMLTVVASARRGRDQTRPYDNWIDLVADWLVCNGLEPPRLNPSWFEAFIKQLVYPVHRAALVRLFDRLLLDADGCFSCFPIGRWRTMASNGAGPIHGRGAGGGFHVIVAAEAGVAAHDLRNSLGIRSTRMTNLIRRLAIQPVARLGEKRKYLILSHKDADRISDACRQGRAAVPVVRRDVLAHLGLTKRRNVVRRLVQAQQLKVEGSGARREFTDDTPNELLSALDEVALPADPRSEATVSLDDESLYLNFWTGPIKELYEDMKSGAERVFRSEGRHGLGRFAVTICVLTRLSRRTADYARSRHHDPRQLELPYVGAPFTPQ